MSSTRWRCTVCGYIHHGDEAPEICPLCGAGRDAFEPLAEAPPPTPTAWRCALCGYIHHGEEPPETCPLCGAPREDFEPVADVQAPAPPASETGDFTGRAVIVGAGIAGIAAAAELRAVAPSATIVVLEREHLMPYQRLHLTRYLAGVIERDELALHDEAWYQEQRIDVRLHTEVTGVDPAAGLVHTAGGVPQPYDRLILAAGAHPFVPPVEGAGLEGVHSLRTLDDADAILAAVGDGVRVVVVGGGILGMETAAALRERGATVSLLESYGWLMPRQLPRPGGEVLAGHLATLGIELISPARTTAFEGEERVQSVRLEDDRRLPADVVVICAGVRSNSHLARGAGLEVARGMVVDDHLASDRDGIYACGDLAEHNGLLYGSWAAARFQGAIAGRNVGGVATAFGGLPRNHSLKVVGIDLVSIGRFEPEDGSDMVIDDQAQGRFRRFCFRDGRLVGAVFVGDTRAVGDAKAAIEAASDCTDLLAERPDAEAVIAFLQRG